MTSNQGAGTVQGGGNEAHERHCSGTVHVIYSPASAMRVLSAGMGQPQPDDRLPAGRGPSRTWNTYGERV